MSALPNVQDLIVQINSFKPSASISETEHTRIKEALFAAYRRFESPWDIAEAHNWAHHCTNATINTLTDVKLWEKWATLREEKATVQDLAKMCRMDETLLRRLLAYLSGRHLIRQLDADTYVANAFTNALADAQFAALYRFGNLFTLPLSINFPSFIAAHGHIDPIDRTDSNAHSTWGTSAFERIQQNPAEGMAFNDAMKVYASHKTPWVNIFPTEMIVQDAKEDGILLVDIGGGIGHDVERFRLKHPNLSHGSLVLQDLAAVTANSIVQAPAIAQPHDMFTPQPVEAARAYFLHMVLHDWPDDAAVAILANIVPSMQKGYSKILLCEIVIRSVNATPRSTLSDVTMMMWFSARERTEEEWRALVARVPELRIVKIWSVPQGGESIIELELARGG